jgi:predicted transcriptional regulator
MTFAFFTLDPARIYWSAKTALIDALVSRTATAIVVWTPYTAMITKTESWRVNRYC